MIESEFHLLASRVLAGEASPEERIQLERLLDDAGRRRQFDELRVTCATLRNTSTLLEAVGSDPEPVPTESLSRLLVEIRSGRGARSDRPQPRIRDWIRVLLGQRSTVGAVAVIGCCLFLGWLVFIRSSAPPPQGGPVAYLVTIRGDSSMLRGNTITPASPVQSLFQGDGIHLETGSKAWLIDPTGTREVDGPTTVVLADNVSVPRTLSPQATHSANTPELVLFAPRPVLLTINLLSTTRAANGISIYSPRGATARLNPTILWSAELGATYELSLQDELNPNTAPWEIVDVRPPVDFAEVESWRERPLAPDHVYRLSIRRIGQPLTASEITFSTVAPPTPTEGDSPASRLLAAHDALTGSPPRVGDALADLLALPEPFANSELALRLKLLAFGRLGLTEEFQSIHSELERSR
jgi:hypothetical protein